VESLEHAGERVSSGGRPGQAARRRERWSRLQGVLVKLDHSSSIFDPWARFGLMVGIVGVIAVFGVLVGAGVASLPVWTDLDRPYVRGAGGVIGFGLGWLMYAHCVRVWADDI
jgi:hypothetical protein